MLFVKFEKKDEGADQREIPIVWVFNQLKKQKKRKDLYLSSFLFYLLI
jgi:hypothetical protein